MARDLGIVPLDVMSSTSKTGGRDLGSVDLNSSSAALAHSQATLDNYKAEAAQAKQVSDKANSPVGIAQETAKGTVGSIANTGLKFLQSAIHAPIDIFNELTGKGTDTSIQPNFSGEGQQTFQGEFKSKTLPDVASGKQSPLGATVGTVGGVVGGGLDILGAEGLAKQAVKAPSAVAKATGLTDFFANRKTQKAVDSALKNITPAARDLTPGDYEELLNKGRVQPKTATTPAKIIPNKNDTRLATGYKDYLQDKDPVKNINNVITGIAEKDKEVGDYLRSHNAIYNTGELRNHLLNSVKDITDIYVPDVNRLNKMKSDVVEGIINDLPKNDLESLWQDRKRFDAMIDSKLNAFGGSQTLKKEIALAVRNGVQDFIKNATPDTTYADKMKQMTDLFDVRDLLDTKGVKEKGQSAIKVWAKNNPGKAKTLGWVIPAGIAGATADHFLTN